MHHPSSRERGGGAGGGAGGGGGGGGAGGAGGGEESSSSCRPGLLRSESSGYSSGGDSQPTSPLCPRPGTSDRATQTRSPAGQVLLHSLHRLREEPQQHGQPSSASSTRRRNAAEVMQTEAIGQELRRIGDDFNSLLLLRRMAGGRVVIHPNPLPHIHQEPAMLLCVGLLLLLIGRIIYLQGSTNSQDHSQV